MRKVKGLSKTITKNSWAQTATRWLPEGEGGAGKGGCMVREGDWTWVVDTQLGGRAERNQRRYTLPGTAMATGDRVGAGRRGKAGK